MSRHQIDQGMQSPAPEYSPDAATLPADELEEDASPFPDQLSRASGRGTATALLLLGVVSIGASVGIALAPEYSWKVTRVARQLAALGYDQVLFAFGGIVLFAVGLVGRALSASRSEPEIPVDLAADVDRVQLRVTRIEAVLDEIQAQASTLLEGQGSLLRHQEIEEHRTQEKSYDAVFRLAASLDHLSARLDDRVASLAAEVQQRIGEVIESVEESRVFIDRSIQAMAAPASRPATPPPSDPPPPAGDDTKPDRKQEDELEVVVELEEDAPPRATEAEIFEALEELDSLVGGPESRPQTAGEALYGTPPGGDPLDLDGLFREEGLPGIPDDGRDR